MNSVAILTVNGAVWTVLYLQILQTWTLHNKSATLKVPYLVYNICYTPIKEYINS